MKNLLGHFQRSEFACKCGCGFTAADAELVAVLNDAREYFNAPITITSGCRCEKHNTAIGGAKNSQHTKGIAADIIIKGVSSDSVKNYFLTKYPDRYGIAERAGSFVHIDMRDAPTRWEY
jgi:uncharacterized protein YcbK (DUF882 family)